MTTKITRPAVSRGFLRKYTAKTPSDEYQGAECLYMIVMGAIGEEGDSRDVFRPADIGDVDGDGYPEFLDAWGVPIRFLRWAPGFNSELRDIVTGTVSNSSAGPPATVEAIGSNFSATAGSYVGGTIGRLDSAGGPITGNQVARITGYQYDPATRKATFTCGVPSSTMQQAFFGALPANGDSFAVMAADPFDPSGVYPIYSATASPPSPDTSVPSFAIYPLIYSAGPNKCFGITSDSLAVLHYTNENLNPFVFPGGTNKMMGTMADAPMEPNFVSNGWLDNIHNHLMNTR
jgi:hypothetical protein